LGQQEINVDEEEENNFINNKNNKENLRNDIEILLSIKEKDLSIFFFFS
jgi:hypothetical protein